MAEPLLPPAVEENQRRAVNAAFAVVVVYMLARAIVYRFMPVTVETPAGPSFSVDLWSLRDLGMSVPRLVALGACLWIAGRRGGLRAWGWTPALGAESIPFLAAGVAGFVLPNALVKHGGAFSAGEIATGWLATGPVALFEEACFRGLFYIGLRSRWGKGRAALASSALFAAYHLQAQPLTGWPKIFLFGLTYCFALELGAGLPWLVLGHWLTDGLYFNLEDGSSAFLGFRLGLGLLVLGAAAAAGWRKARG
ncbi:MAG: CPBP family intramembrane metalloprotease [Elusimicrobia bacterium]|nr:CPBP family intramembrane metalloprotease [Elusimicrobiota bacterium]